MWECVWYQIGFYGIAYSYVFRDKVFSKSPKADELREAAARTEGPSASAETLQGPVRQRSIITLSSQSNPASPSPPIDNKLLPPHPNIRLTNSFEELDVITSNTRSIAALAAQRRSKVHLNTVNSSERAEGHNRSNSDENKLTMSRLAYHDKKYSGSQTFRNALDETASNYTDQEGFSTQRSNQNRIKYRKNPSNKRLPPMHFGNRQKPRIHEPTKQVIHVIWLMFSLSTFCFDWFKDKDRKRFEVLL